MNRDFRCAGQNQRITPCYLYYTPKAACRLNLSDARQPGSAPRLLLLGHKRQMMGALSRKNGA